MVGLPLHRGHNEEAVGDSGGSCIIIFFFFEKKNLLFGTTKIAPIQHPRKEKKEKTKKGGKKEGKNKKRKFFFGSFFNGSFFKKKKVFCFFLITFSSCDKSHLPLRRARSPQGKIKERKKFCLISCLNFFVLLSSVVHTRSLYRTLFRTKASFQDILRCRLRGERGTSTKEAVPNGRDRCQP